MMVPVRSLAEVQSLGAARLNVAAFNRACHAVGTECVMVFTFETERPKSTVHVRMFAPLLGVPEDPATGSANGALGAYLVHHASASSALCRAVPVSGPTVHIVSEQGAELGRPSTLYVQVDVSDGEPVRRRLHQGHPHPLPGCRLPNRLPDRQSASSLQMEERNGSKDTPMILFGPRRAWKRLTLR
jgi:PhzF family phenazine biosynthesis protein